MHALFPISVDNRIFSTERTSNALKAGLQKYERITFLIADQIQVYNDIAKANEDVEYIASLDWSGGYRKDLHERQQWLRRIRKHLTDWPQAQNWRVVGVGDVSNHLTYIALRSAWILYQIDDTFRRDVDDIADIYVEHRRTKTNSNLFRQMSVAYLLEEIAINVRLRVVRNIYDEFYMGDTISVLPKLYGGFYLKTPHEMVGYKITTTRQNFRFHKWSDDHWTEITIER